ncbi:hypothetical protein ALQ57_102354 [Pseudomonas amygdali pv. hibisci]|uniref:Uncharacterized protein n=1 Tax=Pseudomonas amygdali pv. hibisci TaxID=251723 RepID=A0AB34UD42_PSEA0|nr:hypothetical protein AC519_1604 [Pseudomonas savastanoi]KPC49520.1 Unknown protein sequence [Pseudomonas amygdali pv. morsprunorum]KPX58019.1 hypothetical protein ALO67_102305 [Pseudomonas amygdali pv. hibisci]KPY74221.1 hypothetical protein ALO58_102826 [Pseudomonas savastanoi pv. savastanoi]RML29750.1 hypothetical protein ALR00_103169 [Pseudomonas savastanoi pv. retacarpa]
MATIVRRSASHAVLDALRPTLPEHPLTWINHSAQNEN